MSQDRLYSPFEPPCPQRADAPLRWGRLYGNSIALALSQAAEQQARPVLLITADSHSAQRLQGALRFYRRDPGLAVLTFPDWETLPYDVFSPHQDIISERLATLHRLRTLEHGIVIVPIQTLMQRIAPRQFLDGHSLMLAIGERLDPTALQENLVHAGYRHVSAVMEHGEFAVRGNLVDLFPMGSRRPYRIELFDEDIESIRSFDPDTQRSVEKVEQVRLLPAHEFPLDKAAITRFRNAYRAAFEGDPQQSVIYRDVSQGIAPAGIEYYLPLFYDEVETLFDYLPTETLIVQPQDTAHAAGQFWEEIEQRYEQGRHNLARPLLAPQQVFLTTEEVAKRVEQFPRVIWQSYEFEDPEAINFSTEAPVNVTLNARLPEPAQALKAFLADYHGRVLFAAETSGRRESLLGVLREADVHPTQFDGWAAFAEHDAPVGITVAPLEQGAQLQQPPLAVIGEPQLFGTQVLQRRRRQRDKRDADAVIRNLAELNVGAPVVHEDYGVGRYKGLQHLTIGDTEGEFLTLEYADQDILYVPVASLHLISRYTGASPETAPLHKLGSGQWERAKRKASEKVRDVAAELLEIYAMRQAREGYAYEFDDAQYRAFAAGFPFEETPDQQSAIDAVIANMRSRQPMDQLICGDVGFGKTEVAMRAAFIAVQSGKQVAVLAPTTLLTQQHLQTFRDRFADWPVRVEAISRLRSTKEQQAVIDDLATGRVDIVIGTHKLLQSGIKYRDLGLVIIDEEHRFGVRQKDKFKALRAEVDVLTLTATPIPRTLNMAMSGIRDLSIIATPPARRLAIKTFVTQWSNDLVIEACQREIKRGGQVYFLHNDVDSIAKQTEKLAELIPEARVRFAHGQMRERELEQVMADFYHQRFNVLVCTTIIETGIDIPNANTIVINRADRFGLAQLYQLRGRVGRSHHRAYCYLITPPKSAITADAQKRLEAIESIDTLGTGFMLATHDLEIRGAGELLGDEQSGQMHEIGYSLYTELLERAVNALKAGREPAMDLTEHTGAEVELHTPALIPEDYLPDVHERLILYKRIASARNAEALRELQVEMVDRFGLLPAPTQSLFTITELKQRATPMGIRKIDLGPRGGRIVFESQPNIDPGQVIKLIQTRPQQYKLDSNEKLRINKELAEPAARIEELEHLLDTLAISDAA
jgi:transcription-repair coupling factor (superfamily II helicase)